MFGDRFVGTPEIGLGLSDAERELRLGWRLGLARREAVNDDDAPEHGVGLRLSVRW